MKKVLLFLNGKLGLDILEFLIHRHDATVLAVVINSPKKRKPDYLDQIKNILLSQGREIETFQYSENLWESLEFTKHLTAEIFGISVLFGHIFPQSIITKFNRNLINLHPSLLPIGRGADPIFWSIVNALPHGVTIHRVNETIDSGEIFIQEELEINSWLNSGEIYELAMAKIYQLFVNFYPNWDSNSISTIQEGEGTYHEQHELEKVKTEILESPGNLFKYLNLIQALTYNDDRKARIRLPNNQIWEVSLNLKRIEG